MSTGKLIIFSAPSGSGKTTIVKHLISKFPELGFSISACTRDKRGRHEEHGKDYYFLTPEDFRIKIAKDEFVEWEEVYAGNYYGTLISEIERLWDSGKTVIFDVDVKGGLNLKKHYQDKALAVYVKVPNIEELTIRLQSRGTETEESISRRIFKAQFEMGFMNQFDVILDNSDLDKTFPEAEKLVSDFLKK